MNHSQTLPFVLQLNDCTRNFKSGLARLSMLYRCSQDISCASYSKYDKESAVHRRKRRRRTIQHRYNCAGHINLNLWIPDSENGAMIEIPGGTINLGDGEILLHLNHKCSHPPRQRKPIPQAIREFIQYPDNSCYSTFEMCRKLRSAAQTGKLDSIDMIDITDDNIHYWQL